MSNLEFAARKLVEALGAYGHTIDDLFGHDEKFNWAYSLLRHELGIETIDPEELEVAIEVLENE